jgi:hypothetical protein
LKAYAAPFAAAVLGGFFVLIVLGVVRLARLGRDRAQPTSGPPPGAARDAVPDAADPLLPRLAFRLLAVALFLGLSGLLLFAPFSAGETVAAVRPHPLVVAALLAAWALGERP